MPVTVGHPRDTVGNLISARSPEVFDRYRVGTVFAANVRDGSLNGEAWIDVEAANRFEPLASPEPLATGYASQSEPGRPLAMPELFATAKAGCGCGG